ncbi:MAG: hypothetical protein L0H84_14660, partial [Pseudonocardia sp.]|nr:hypothetical protein [Pseudonocardia sp.]
MSGLPAAGRGGLRALRPGPATDGPLARGPVCDPCYTAALRRRGTCTGCGQPRRLVAPPGPDATTCPDCAAAAGLAASPITGHVCGDCGVEDKLYERGRCAACALRRRTTELLRGGTEHIAPELSGVLEAITAAPVPRSALNWLRKGAGAKLLAELAAGALPLNHEALDTHPHRRAADYLRAILVANQVLPGRDEALQRTERFLAELLGGIDHDPHRRLVAAFATWRVLRRLRRAAQRHPRPRTYTRRARQQISAAARFLAWLTEHHTSLREATQTDVDTWLTGRPENYQVRDFLDWAGAHGHCAALHVPLLGRVTGATTSDADRFAQLARLLHEENLPLTDRVAGALLLLYGQPLSRIAAITTDQISHRDQQVLLRFGHHDVHLPEPLAGLIVALARDGRRYRGVGSPTASTWLFPGLLPGHPLTPARLGERL